MSDENSSHDYFLASNLRYTIKGSVLVPLSAEMEYVKNYIFLQKMRNEDLFEFLRISMKLPKTV